MSNFAFFLSDEFKADFNGRIKIDEPMKNHTTFRIGGIAPLFLEPENEKSLILAVKKLKEQEIEFFVLGGGSNIVMADEIDFAVISTRQMQNMQFSTIKGKSGGLLKISLEYRKELELKSESDKRYINCDAGATWGQILNLCVKKKFSGFESFAGLPGTVGGATYINATCFGFSLCDNLVSVRYLDLDDFEIKTYDKNPSDWGYKKSPFQTNKRIVLSAEFEVKETDKTEEEIKADYMKTMKERALKKHFEAPSAGSVFRNIPEQNIIAGKIIDECGLKGMKVGGAKVADWHGNFIINEENATSKDVKELVKMIQDKVKSEKGVDLKCEIIFVPENVDIK